MSPPLLWKISGLAWLPPTSCPGVPADVLQPKSTWSNGEAYDTTADKLASMFNENFKRYEEGVSTEVNAAAPVALS